MAYKRAAYSCDLHTHTNHSDGRKTPKEVIDEAAEVGLKVLAITDHDVIPPEFIDTEDGPVSVTEYARKKGIICIPGIEISCDTENEDVHLVCLGCDWKHPFSGRWKKKFRAANWNPIVLCWKILKEQVIMQSGTTCFARLET